MLKSYFKIGLRNLRKDKINSFINIFGLAVGFASCIFLFLFVRNELTYDHFHKNADRIFRVTHDETPARGPGGRHLATVGPPVGPALERSFPEILEAVRVRYTDRHIISYQQKHFYEENIVYTDSTLFKVFTFPLQAGNPKTALAEPNSVVISERMAKKYFRDKNPLGKVLMLDNHLELKVSGVLAPIPENSHLQFDFAISFATFTVPRGYPVSLDTWGWISFHTYLLLDEQANTNHLETKFPEFIKTHWSPERADQFKWRLQPLKDIYLGDVLNPDLPSGNIAYIYGLIGIGLLILLMGCFNFMNLAIARSITRGNEIGIRKVLGAFKGQIIRQYLGESILTAILALALAIVLVEFFIGILQKILNFGYTITVADYGAIIPIFLGLSVIVGLLSGAYPAFVLSQFRPSKVLKGNFKPGSSGFWLRKVLVIAQFTITIALIAGTVIISRQLDYIGEKDLGFDKEEVIILSIPREEAATNYNKIKTRLLQNPSVVSVSASGGLLDGNNGNVPIFTEGDAEDEGKPVNVFGVQYDFFKTLHINVEEGRTLSPNFSRDTSQAVILNKAAVDLLGWDDPVGKPLRVSDLVDGHVIGVVDNFHFTSLHYRVEPLAIFYASLVENIYVRVKPGNTQQILASLKSAWLEIVPGLPFHFTFLDENLNRLYAADRTFARLITVFSILTIFVAALGLYGLVAFVTRQRTKEIGLRKVLGASVINVVTLLSKDFISLMIFANLIGWPIAYYAMTRWLQNFAYQVGIDLWIFILAGGTALMIAQLTMSFQAIRAALTNPVEALRYE